MTARHILIMAAAAAAATAPASAATPAAPQPARYVVDIVARDGDAAPTTPRLVVEQGSTATYMVANDSYSLRLTTVPESVDDVALHSQIATWTPHGLRNDGGRVELRADGIPATVSFARTEPATGEEREVVVEVRVRPLGD